IDDIGDGLRGQMGKAGDMHPAERTVATHDIKHHAPIMITDSLGILAEGDSLRSGSHGCRCIFRFRCHDPLLLPFKEIARAVSNSNILIQLNYLIDKWLAKFNRKAGW